MRRRTLGLILALLLAAVSSASAAPTVSLGIQPAMPIIEEPISAIDWIEPEIENEAAHTSSRTKAAVHRSYRLAEHESISVIPEPTTLLLLGLALAGLAAGRQLME